MKGKKSITNQIGKKLKEIDRSDATYTQKQESLKKLLSDIYSNAENVSLQDIIKRKAYLQSRLDSQNTILGTSGLAIIVWLVLEGGRALGLCFFEDYSNSFSQIIPILIAPFWALLVCWPISHWLGRVDTKYREYNLIDFELDIINAILEEHLHYKQAVNDIIKSRCKIAATPKDQNDET